MPSSFGRTDTSCARDSRLVHAGRDEWSTSGAVYGLTRREDFAGAYAQVRKGWALGDQGKGTLWLANSKGVTMRLKMRRKGLQLSPGADAVVIAFK